MKKLLVFLFAMMLMTCGVIASNAADIDCHVYGAADLVERASAGGGLVKQDSFVTENGTTYISALADGSVSNGVDGTQLKVLITAQDSTDFLLKEYPIMKVSYDTDIKADSVLDICLGMNYCGRSTRLWGFAPEFKRGSQSMIIDLSVSFGGGENLDKPYSWDNVDDDSPVNYLTFKPYYSGKSIVKGEHFNIEYIGFFRTEADAKAYKYDSTVSYDPKSIEFNIQAVRRKIGETLKLEALPVPYYANLDSVVFRSEDPTVATVASDGTVTAVAAGDTYIVAETQNGLSAKCHIYVLEKAIAPVELIPHDIVTTRPDVVINCLGDSITTYASAPTAGMNYHDWFGKWYHVTNNDYGISGATLSANGNNQFVYRYQNMTDDADIIFVKGGTNDFGGTPIGDQNSRLLTTYRGAVRNLIEGLIEKYPDKHIVFLSVIHRSNGDFTPETKNVSGSVLGDFAAATEELAREYGIDSLDIYNPEQLDFTKPDVVETLMPDKLHPSGEGHKIIAEYIIEKLTEKGVLYVNADAENETVYVDDYKLYKAKELVRAANGANLKIDNTTVSEDDSEYVRIHAGTYKESIDSTQAIFSLKTLGNDWLLKDYPFMKIGYKTNIAASNTSEIIAKRGGKYSRHWGIRTAFENDGKPHDTVLNLASAISGALEAGYTAFSDIDDDSRVNEVWFKPWGGHSLAEMKTDEYLDIEYIAFFRTSVEADAFEYSLDSEPLVRGSGFTDTPEHWGCDYIDFTVRRGLFNGMTETTFEPNSTMKRSMLVTVLSRLAKDTENTTAYPFADVSADKWFSHGVSFAYDKKLVDDGENFRPDDMITREELADMLYRFAKAEGKDTSGDELGFKDTDNISADKRDALAYCVKLGIISGYDDNTVRPNGSATRAEVAAMLTRFIKNVK